MTQNIENLGKHKFKFNEVISSVDLNIELTNEINKNKTKFKIQGFRAGKVPVEIIKKNFGADILEDVANKLAKNKFLLFVEKEKIKLIGTPRINFKNQPKDDADLEMFVEYEVYPDVNIPDLSKLTLELDIATVEDSDVHVRIEALRFKHAKWVEVSDEATAKDKVTIDFTGKLDGVAFDGGSATGYAVELGMKKMLPDFEAGIIGMKLGEEKTFPVSFPAEYGAENLAGKTADFTIKLHKIERATLSDLNDEAFLKQVNAKDETELKEKTKNAMLKEVEKLSRQIKENKIVELLNKEIELELPEQLVTDEAMMARENAIQQYGNQAKFKIKAEDLPLDLFKTDVENKIKTSFIIGSIIESEKLEASNEDVENFLRTQQGENYEQAMNYYKNNQEQYNRLSLSVTENKVFDFISNKLKINEKKVTVEELLSSGR